MRRVSLILLVVFLALCGAAGWLPNNLSVVNAQGAVEPAQSSPTDPSRLSVDDQPTAADPLPSSCPGGLPGDAPAVCCVSGLVYVDGQPVAGADVEITNASGQVVRTVTQVQGGKEPRPYYHISLSGEPLNIQPGDLITITAHYRGQQDVEQYTIGSGGQQVDLVLTRQQNEGFVAGGRLFKQAKVGDILTAVDVVVDKLNRLYVLDAGNLRVHVMDNSGNYITSWSINGVSSEDLTTPTALGIDVNDNFVYILDDFHDRIQKFSTNGEWLATWLLAPGLVYSAIAVDRQGNIYLGVIDPKPITKFDKNGKKLDFMKGGQTYPSFQRIYVDDQHGIVYGVGIGINGPVFRFGINGESLSPMILRDTNGNLGNVIAMDSGGILYALHTTGIWQHDYLGRPLRKWCSSPVLTSYGVLDNQNNLYAAGSFGGVLKLKSDCTTQLFPNKEEIPIQSFYGAKQLVADSIGNFYFGYSKFLAQPGITFIQMFDQSGEFTKFLDKSGTGDGKFYDVTDIAIDKDRNLYLVDGLNTTIQAIDSAGIWLSTWTSATLGISETISLRAVAVDVVGNVYVSTSNDTVLKVSSDGQVLATLGSSGNGIGQFSQPYGLATDSAGNLFVADRNNDRVQKLSPTGVWTTIGEGTLFRPILVAVDGSGNLYVGGQGASGLAPLQKFDKDGHLLFSSRTPVYEDLLDITIDSTGTLVALMNSQNVYFLQRFAVQGYTTPIATINRLASNASALPYDGRLQVFGQGQDSDETPGITAFEWTFHAYDSGQTQIFTTTTSTFSIAASQLGTGSHRLTLRVRDDENEWSEPVTTDKIYVNPPATPPWTFLLYLVGDYDDKAMRDSFDAALQNISYTLNITNVRVAVQLDPFGNDGTRRYFFGPGAPGFNHPEDIGEQAMDKSSTLRDFIREGQKRFPAQHYYLAIADHGQAIRGIGWDKTSGDDAYLSIDEIRRALSDSAVADIDVLHLDGCSMGLFDVAYELRHNADFLIVSQYLAWSYFAYADYQVGITANTTPEQLAKSVAETYAKKAAQDQYPYTLSVLNLNPSQMDGLKHSLDDLAALLKEWVRFDEAGKDARIQVLRQIRSQSQKFNSNADFLNNDSDFYVDLADWLSNLLAYTPEAGAPDFTDAIRDEAKRLQRGITLAGGGQPLVIANQQMSNFLPSKFLPEGTREVYPTGVYIDLTHANGVSVYYPIDKDAPKPPSAAGASATTPTFDEVYNDYIHERIFEFTLATRWDEFLQLAVGAPQADAPLAPPPVPILILPTVPATSTQTQLFLPVIMR